MGLIVLFIVGIVAIPAGPTPGTLPAGGIIPLLVACIP